MNCEGFPIAKLFYKNWGSPLIGTFLLGFSSPVSSRSTRQTRKNSVSGLLFTRDFDVLVLSPLSFQNLRKLASIRSRSNQDVKPWTVEQYFGEAVFISAGCPHQVRNRKVRIEAMKDLQVSLNQTQKVRLQSALQKLQEIASKSGASVTIADSIPVNNEDGILKGHGTLEYNGEVVATLCGVVERVNKLVYVRPLRARYKPEVGDIIVGRVLEIAPKRWRLEINFSQDAVLMLSSMNLPDGIQRRRTAVDELNMRSIFEENDVVCAEVRGFQHDGSLQLQARSQKYGKLERGQLLSVPAYLVKRRKQHFHHLEKYGVDLILGCNGFIWVGEHVESKGSDPMAEDLEPKRQGILGNLDEVFTPFEVRQHICRIANSIRMLSTLGFTLSVEVIVETAEASISSNVAIKSMLGAEFCVQTAEREVQRRLSKRRN